MIKHTFTIADASAADREVATRLSFSPPTGQWPRAIPPGVVLVAVMSGHPDDMVAVTATAAAKLAVELTHAFDIVPPEDLVTLAHGRDVVVAAAPDPRDALLRTAFRALLHGTGVEQRDAALSIAEHALGSEWAP